MGLFSGLSKLAGSITGGDLISGGTALLGGFLGDKSAKDQARLAKDQFNQQMDHSIRRRVEDAKRAGIHPLYALGASVGSSPTIMAGQSGSGSSIGDAVASIGANFASNREARQANAQAARLAELKMHMDARESQARINRDNAAARLDNVEAMARLSRNALATQALASRNTGENIPDQSPIHMPIFGKVKPGPHTSQQYVEDQYGGVLGEAYGLGRAVTEYGDYLGRTFIGPGLFNYNKRGKGNYSPVDENVAP